MWLDIIYFLLQNNETEEADDEGEDEAPEVEEEVYGDELKEEVFELYNVYNGPP